MKRIMTLTIAFFVLILFTLAVVVGLPRYRSYANQKMFEALNNNDSNRVRKWVGLGADVNARDACLYNWPALFMAVRNNNLIEHDGLEIIECLLEHGADPNCQHDGVYVLELTSSHEVMKMLVDAGADWKSIEERLLGVAIMEDDASRVQYLVDLDCRPDLKGNAPLSVSVLEILVEAGLDLKKNEEMLLEGAIRSNELDLVKHLLTKGCSPNVQSNEMGFPLCYAADLDAGAMCELLIEFGANVNALARGEVREDGVTPTFTALHSAAFYDSNEALTVLLSHGAQMDIKNHDGKTPLELAGPRCRKLLQD